jgi:hypothetical protein
MELISPAYIAWRAGTSNRVVVLACQAWNRLLGSLKGLQIRALYLQVDFRQHRAHSMCLASSYNEIQRHWPAVLFLSNPSGKSQNID